MQNWAVSAGTGCPGGAVGSSGRTWPAPPAPHAAATTASRRNDAEAAPRRGAAWVSVLATIAVPRFEDKESPSIGLCSPTRIG
ncbi:hypothetical protein GCM10009559_79190 [Pseudonocardia zijingensis]|uniref:Uncharacterized protein n=1 Tax=Pseudonocardia zijingensis TaxID=153376 RepID=A0ABN1NID5_9PSEU